MKIKIFVFLVNLIYAFFTFTTYVLAVPINSNVAFTPYKWQTIIRNQVRYTKKADDPTSQDRDIQVWMFPAAFLYGVTEKYAISFTLPYVAKKQESLSGGSRSTISDSGIGDVKLISKYRIWNKDLLGKTQRFSLIGGLALPAGDNKAYLKRGSGSCDPIAGIVFSKQNLATHAAERGVYSPFNFVLECNGEYSRKSKSMGTIVKDLNGSQVETDAIISSGIRITF